MELNYKYQFYYRILAFKKINFVASRHYATRSLIVIKNTIIDPIIRNLVIKLLHPVKSKIFQILLKVLTIMFIICQSIIKLFCQNKFIFIYKKFIYIYIFNYCSIS